MYQFTRSSSIEGNRYRRSSAFHRFAELMGRLFGFQIFDQHPIAEEIGDADIFTNCDRADLDFLVFELGIQVVDCIRNVRPLGDRSICQRAAITTAWTAGSSTNSE